MMRIIDDGLVGLMKPTLLLQYDKSRQTFSSPENLGLLGVGGWVMSDDLQNGGLGGGTR